MHTIENIKNLLSEGDKHLASSIDRLYKDYIAGRMSILLRLNEALSKNNIITKKLYYKVRDGIIDHTKERINHSTGYAIEAIAAYARFKHVNTVMSLEDMADTLINKCRKEHAVWNNGSFEHYIVGKRIANVPNEAIVETALESIVKGRLNGVTGLEQFSKDYSVRYDISEDILGRISSIFKEENKIVMESGSGIAIAALEKFFANDYVVGKKIASCPQCTVMTFPSKLQEGDVLIVYRKKDYIGIGGVVLNKINSWVTGSSFMSIKLVGPQAKTVIGYGAWIGSTECREVPIDYFLETCSGIIAIRHKNINDMYRKKILEYAKNVLIVNPRYDFYNIVKTMFTHGREERKGAEKILSKNEAKHYYVPMICTTLITAAYRSAGLDPGVPFSDKSAWPIDVLKSDKFVGVATYFENREGMRLNQYEAKENLNIVIPKYTEEDDVSMELFFSRNATVRDVIKKCPKVSIDELKSIAREGDAITVTRVGKDTWKSWTNKHIMQGQSFTSLKMIGPNCDSVIGYGVTLSEDGGGIISEYDWNSFVDTCRAIVICRPIQATPEQLHEAYEYMRVMQGRNIKYMSVTANLASCIRHILQFGKRDNKTPMTREELEQWKGPMICSSVVAAAWRYAGIDNGFHSVKEKDVWPRDYLLSTMLSHPACWFIKGEYPEYYDSI